MDLSNLKAKQQILYIGKSLAFGGEYTLYPIEETYTDIKDCPIEDRGKMVIIEFTNDGKPMFFTLQQLNPNDWELV